MSKTKSEIQAENVALLDGMLQMETSMAALRMRNGQLLGALEKYCPEAAESLTTYSSRWAPMSKVHHLVFAAIKGNWDSCKELAKELEEDYKIEIDNRKKRVLSPEHIAAMQAGRKVNASD